jgi:hypothetical protein
MFVSLLTLTLVKQPPQTSGTRLSEKARVQGDSFVIGSHNVNYRALTGNMGNCAPRYVGGHLPGPLWPPKWENSWSRECEGRVEPRPKRFIDELLIVTVPERPGQSHSI